MAKYLFRRFIYALFIVFFGLLIVYTVIRFLPTSFMESVARNRSNQPGAMSYREILAQLNAVYGMDKGIIPGFIKWGGNALRGDFGISWLYNIPVIEKFKNVIWYSIFLNIVTLLVQMLVSIPLGVLAARKQYSKTDYAITVFTMICISLPTFFLATILKYIFSVKLGWFDLYGIVGRYYEQLDTWGKILRHGEASRLACNYALHAQSWRADALYPNQYARGDEFRLYSDPRVQRDFLKRL